ncbi:NAD(P)-dependent dehydrogenase (short-subunit alcohol dehydrogenase family) [Sphingomonas leidyi]|uniref:NAD(P)-dependent dehydrogenase (Short-subunit alcohol dehydrogenase family) n=1 Tax=Sphingomonas leidyi TaxID=68569 RepID=A0A7X5ZXN3_9SPHN|nr:SDR family oxidoreductase [Sphingomonas leidyi]NIJ66688.1 NAD(P)-dependent dehydrogenase (short-subunit alcohol dehydrogenase family) [Sphingomonas leidyi]
MSRILVIGGYGGFGARLSRRLLAAGHEVLVAGRSHDRAAAFCAGHPGAEPVVADRTNGIGMVLARERPDLVIDAAGPFQGSGYTVPEACIAMRIPYLDLADSRDFVTGIAALNKGPMVAVPIVSGASSVPALSGAVVRALAAGLPQVERIDIAISASNRAVAGPSVAAAILSYVGKPVRVWRGQRWMQATGWQDLRRERFAIEGEAAPLRRWIALAEVPDLSLAPELLPGRPATTFRAGTELGFQMLALWLLSWPVRWGWLRTLRGAAPWLHELQRITAWAGSDRSAMSVTLVGAGVRRRWTLIADRGDGPEIPTLAAELLAGDILAGRVPPGAQDASRLLTLDRFEPLFVGLAIRHAVREHAVDPLYARAMGARFARLPEQVRAMHAFCGDAGAEGEGEVRRGRGLAWLVGRVMGFPPSGSYPLRVAFAARDGKECWTRDFGGHAFSSELGQAGQGVAERFGPLRFAFDLPSDDKGLRMVLRRWSAFGVPMPRLLAPRIAAREWQEDGRFRFEVRVALPLLGAVVHYTGWLARL